MPNGYNDGGVSEEKSAASSLREEEARAEAQAGGGKALKEKDKATAEREAAAAEAAADAAKALADRRKSALLVLLFFASTAMQVRRWLGSDGTGGGRGGRVEWLV